MNNLRLWDITYFEVIFQNWKKNENVYSINIFSGCLAWRWASSECRLCGSIKCLTTVARVGGHASIWHLSGKCWESKSRTLAGHLGAERSEAMLKSLTTSTRTLFNENQDRRRLSKCATNPSTNCAFATEKAIALPLRQVGPIIKAGSCSQMPSSANTLQTRP